MSLGLEACTCDTKSLCPFALTVTYDLAHTHKEREKPAFVCMQGGQLLRHARLDAAHGPRGGRRHLLEQLRGRFPGG